MFTLLFGLCVYVDNEGQDIFSVDLWVKQLLLSSLKCMCVIIIIMIIFYNTLL